MSAGETDHVPKFDLLIDGAAASSAVLESVITIRVHQSLVLADALELKLSNPDLAWTEADSFVEGKELSVKLGYEETGIEDVFTGEIVRRDCEFPVSGPAIVTVVAFDKQAKLQRERRSRTFLDQKDSDFLKTVASDAGLSLTIPDTKVKQPYVVQFNQTNLAFLRERCQRLGFVLTIDAKNTKLEAKAVEDVEPARVLKWGETLLAFNGRMSTASQLSEVTVRAWDMVKKEKIEKTITAKSLPAKFAQDLGATLAEKAGGSRPALFAQTPLFDIGEAEALATSQIDHYAQSYANGLASCQGDSSLRPGQVVELEAIGKRASGKYLINKVLQHFQPGLGYSTHLTLNRPTETVPPAEPEPLPESVAPREGGESEQEHFVEFDVRSTTGEDVTGWSYTVTLPNGETKQGTLDASGVVRVEGVRDPGEVKIEINQPDDIDPLG
ncbi:MAG TPA: hypothetical protein DEA08_06095 [Planctomycetes bacterium]|nr:hypothetical protein [Planctomycetota bacterium]